MSLASVKVGLDTMIKYDMKFGSMNMDFRLDVFNLFDQSGTTEVNEMSELSVGVPSPTYKRDTHYQAPRSVRFGVGFHF